MRFRPGNLSPCNTACEARVAPVTRLGWPRLDRSRGPAQLPAMRYPRPRRLAKTMSPLDQVQRLRPGIAQASPAHFLGHSRQRSGQAAALPQPASKPGDLRHTLVLPSALSQPHPGPRKAASSNLAECQTGPLIHNLARRVECGIDVEMSRAERRHPHRRRHTAFHNSCDIYGELAVAAAMSGASF